MNSKNRATCGAMTYNKHLNSISKGNFSYETACQEGQLLCIKMNCKEAGGGGGGSDTYSLSVFL